MEQKGFSRLSSETISALRFPLMAGIVFIHVGIGKMLAMRGVHLAADMPQWFQLMVTFFTNTLPRIGVPLFFLISGYLFFRSGLTTASYKSKLKKRGMTLLVPYIIWNTIAIIRDAIKNLPCFSSFAPTTGAGDWSLTNILGSFWNYEEYGVFRKVEQTVNAGYIYPEDFPLWYVRDLMIVILLSPVFYYAVKKLGWYFVAALGIVWYLVPVPNIENLPQLKVAAFFFSWGACLSIKGIDFVRSMRHCGFALWLYPIVAVADMFTKEWAYSGYLHNAGIILGIFAAVSLTAWLLENGKIKVNKFLADSSFFLFALHGMIIIVIGKVTLKLVFFNNALFLALVYFLVPIITSAICLALYWLLRRYTPRLCALLTGGR